MVAQIIEKVALEVAYVMLTCRGYVYAVIDRNYRADYVQGVCMPQSDYQLDPWHGPSRSFGSLDHEYAPFQSATAYSLSYILLPAMSLLRKSSFLQISSYDGAVTLAPNFGYAELGLACAGTESPRFRSASC